MLVSPRLRRCYPSLRNVIKYHEFLNKQRQVGAFVLKRGARDIRVNNPLHIFYCLLIEETKNNEKETGSANN